LLPFSNIKIKYTELYSACFVCKSIILLVVLYGRASWSLTLREGSRQRVFVNRVLKRTFGPKMDELTGE
jgi:hypothetical protein